MVHVALAADESLTQAAIQEIIDAVDQDLVDALSVSWEGLVVHVFQVRKVGVFGDENFRDNGADR